MKFAILVAFACMAIIPAAAGTSTRTVDARALLTQATPSKDIRAQAFDQYRFVMNTTVARQAFADAPASIELTNFPVGAMGTQSLDLVRTRAVVDANTKILVGRKGGMKPIVVEPVISYKGTVNGDPNTHVSLHYTSNDITGYIELADGQKLNIGREYSTVAAPNAIPHAVVPEQMLLTSGNTFVCGSEDLAVDTKSFGRHMEAAVKNGEQTQAEYLRELKLALEVNQDLWQKMHDRGQSDEEIIAYFVKVVACLSQAYEEEVDATFYVTYVQMYTNEFETPYTHNGLDPGALLEEFSLNWSNNYNDVDRHLAHLFTMQIQQGGVFIGGIAYGGQNGPRLCSKQFQGAYGVSTMYGTQSPMPGNPSSANAFTWDIFVIAHEMGHNVGSPHTHNCLWSPPVDTCQLQKDNTDACYNTTRVIRPGTIMSYCHLVNGSTTPLTFGDRVAAKMKTWVQGSCAQAPVNPVIRITEPRGSETFESGSTLLVKFASARVSTITMEYSADNGKQWTTVKTGINAADRQYAWTVPPLSTSQLLIRMKSDADGSIADTTLATYTVSVPLVLTAPKGGERVAGASKYTIRWTKTPVVGNCDLDYTTDNGANWTSISKNETGATYEWTVPDIETNNAIVRVKQSSGAVQSVGSAFAIGKPRFAMVIPVSNGSVCNNFVNQFRWSSDFIDRIRVQFTTNAGANWLSATQALNLDASLGEAFSLSTQLKAVPKGTKIAMRVVNNANTTQVLATMDNITVDSCATAVSVQDAEPVPGDLTITSVSPNPARADAALTLRTATSMTVSVMLVDAAGQRIALLDGTTLASDGEHVLALPLQNVAPGSYQLVVRAGNATAVTTMTVVR